jgi:branched-subunit amino acid aminotransferase/4-amino-4-deoxychorismate lyase
MTNTVAGIAVVTNIDGWTIDDGEPGKRTTELQTAYLE